MSKYEREIKDALAAIFDYTGTHMKYVECAQLQTYLQWLLKKCGVEDA